MSLDADSVKYALSRLATLVSGRQDKRAGGDGNIGVAHPSPGNPTAGEPNAINGDGERTIDWSPPDKWAADLFAKMNLGDDRDDDMPHDDPSTGCAPRSDTQQMLSHLDEHVTRINSELLDIFSAMKSDERDAAERWLARRTHEQQHQPARSSFGAESPRMDRLVPDELMCRSPALASHPDILRTNGPRHSIERTVAKAVRAAAHGDAATAEQHSHIKASGPAAAAPASSPRPGWAGSQFKSKSHYDTPTFSRSQQVKSSRHLTTGMPSSHGKASPDQTPPDISRSVPGGASVGSTRITVGDWKKLKSERAAGTSKGPAAKNGGSAPDSSHHSHHDGSRGGDLTKHCSRCVPQASLAAGETSENSSGTKGAGLTHTKKISKQEFECFLERKTRRKNAVEKWKADMAHEQTEAEVQGLTFKPTINKRSRALAEGMPRLEDRAKDCKARTDEKLTEMRENLEKKSLEAVTGQPKINKKSKEIMRTEDHMERWLAKRQTHLAELHVEAKCSEAAAAPFKPQLSQRSLKLAELRRKRMAAEGGNVHAVLVSSPAAQGPGPKMAWGAPGTGSSSAAQQAAQWPARQPVYQHYDDRAAKELAEKRAVLFRPTASHVQGDRPPVAPQPNGHASAVSRGTVYYDARDRASSAPGTNAGAVAPGGPAGAGGGDPLVSLISGLSNDDLSAYTEMLRGQYESAAASAASEAMFGGLASTSLDLLDQGSLEATAVKGQAAAGGASSGTVIAAGVDT